MSANNVVVSSTSNNVKKGCGKIIISINSELLELMSEYKKVKSGGQLSTKGTQLEKSIKQKKEALEEGLKGLDDKPDYVKSEKLEKTVKMLKCNISTANKVLAGGCVGEEVSENDLTDAKKEAQETVEEIEGVEKQVELEMKALLSKFTSLDPTFDVPEDDTNYKETEEQVIEKELGYLDTYQATRVRKMKKEIEDKMDFHKEDLMTKWKEQKDFLEYQALKEIRYEFESTHKKMRFMVNEWDKRKLSDKLSDHLMDKIDFMWDQYMNEFRRMDEEKRKEAAVQRKKNQEMEEYKREKRRAIPSWPKSLSYTKFKPDLLSWDQEHHLSSGGVKFGLLAEMLKSHERITTFEQIQTRLGRNRNDSNIILQVVALLDSINEETVFNKLSAAWDAINGMKRNKNENLNNFFSRFETLQYSLNLSDVSYKEQGKVQERREMN